MEQARLWQKPEGVREVRFKKFWVQVAEEEAEVTARDLSRLLWRLKLITFAAERSVYFLPFSLRREGPAEAVLSVHPTGVTIGARLSAITGHSVLQVG